MAFYQFVCALMALSMVTGMNLPLRTEENVISSVFGDGSEAYRANVEAYWSEERMARALPPHTDDDQVEVQDEQARRYPQNGGNTFIQRNIGRLYFTDYDGKDQYCTATAIEAESKSVIVTAGYCVFVGGLNGKFHTNFLFKVSDGQRTLRFVGKQGFAHSDWIGPGKQGINVGLVVVDKTADGKRVGENALQIGFDALKGQNNSFSAGFPHLRDGEEVQIIDLYYCNGTSLTWRPGYANFLYIKCGFYSHGAPIIHNLDIAKNKGQVVAVTTIKEYHSTRDSTGPIFEEKFRQLYNVVRYQY